MIGNPILALPMQKPSGLEFTSIATGNQTSEVRSFQYLPSPPIFNAVDFLVMLIDFFSKLLLP